MTIKELLKEQGAKGSIFLAGSSVDYAQKNLKDTEMPISAITANVSTLSSKNKEHGVVVLTDKRIFFCSQVLTQRSFKEISIDHIQSLEDKSDIISGAKLIINGISQTFIISGNRKILEQFREKIQKQMENNEPITSSNDFVSKEENKSSKNSEISPVKIIAVIASFVVVFIILYTSMSNDTKNTNTQTSTEVELSASPTIETNSSVANTDLYDEYEEEEEEEPEPTPTPKPKKTPKPVPIGCQNALEKAENYLDTMPFSKKGLIKQLKYEGFSNKESKYAVNHVSVSWKEQAAKKAQDYLDTMAFSKSRLIEQLKYEGFTDKQARYGVKKVGY